MLKNLTILFFVVIAAFTNAQAQKIEDKNADETVIRAQVAQLMKGWNAKSGAEFAKPFAEDADYVVINGMKLKGRAAIDKGHQYIFDTIYQNSTMSLAAESIRFLRADVAVVHVFGTLEDGIGESKQTGSARITLVMTKTGERWEIAAFQNTQIAANETQKK
jgi:uncharacterized protein (TIGR02246 family)